MPWTTHADIFGYGVISIDDLAPGGDQGRVPGRRIGQDAHQVSRCRLRGGEDRIPVGRGNGDFGVVQVAPQGAEVGASAVLGDRGIQLGDGIGEGRLGGSIGVGNEAGELRTSLAQQNGRRRR